MASLQTQVHLFISHALVLGRPMSVSVVVGYKLVSILCIAHCACSGSCNTQPHHSDITHPHIARVWVSEVSVPGSS